MKDMKKTKRMKAISIFSLVMALLMLLVAMASCAAAPNEDVYGDGGNGWFDNAVGAPGYDYNEDLEADNDIAFAPVDPPQNEDPQSSVIENPFVSTEQQPISTFSADVDTASYAYFRKLAGQGYSLDQLKKFTAGNPLRTEEMINYFDYAKAPVAEGDIFGMSATVAKTPWNSSSYLLTLGLSTEAATEKGANNLVFLIDVSGSMASSDKLPLLKKAFSNLVSALDEQDTVSIVTYSGKEEIVLSGCPGNRDEEIMNAINSLVASGSTNGEAGLTKAYSIAKDYFKEDGNNRIIMASDGDLNVGISNPEELKNFISGKKDEGIFLSVMGFGTGNYKDASMSALAQNGNGVYYYIDGEREAEKVLGEDLLSTLYTVAKDVKLQLTFNSEIVSQYRLIGYETRMLNNEDFEDDTKDAGEVGAGHSVTVCYELKLAEGVETLESTFDFATLAIRYKLPDGKDSILKEYAVSSSALTETPSDDFKFISAIIECTMIVNNSKYNADGVDLIHAVTLISDLDFTSDQDKFEFKRIISSLITPPPTSHS